MSQLSLPHFMIFWSSPKLGLLSEHVGFKTKWSAVVWRVLKRGSQIHMTQQTMLSPNFHVHGLDFMNGLAGAGDWLEWLGQMASATVRGSAINKPVFRDQNTTVRIPVAGSMPWADLLKLAIVEFESATHVLVLLDLVVKLHSQLSA